MENIIDKVSCKVIALDNKISIKVYDTCVTFTKSYKNDYFLSKCLTIEEIYKWVGLFGLEMTCKDLINTINEELKECYEDE